MNSDEINPVEALHMSGLGALTEERAMALLQTRQAVSEQIEQIYEDASLMKSRKVRIAVAAYAKTPRRIALRLIRGLYTGDLVHFALSPAANPELKRIAADLLIARLPSVTRGERVSLARRAPTAVAAALLLDRDTLVWQAALENPHLTEAAIAKALKNPGISESFLIFLCQHLKWSSSPEIRIALLLHAKTPSGYAISFTRSLPKSQLRDILHASAMPAELKNELKRMLESEEPDSWQSL